MRISGNLSILRRSEIIVADSGGIMAAAIFGRGDSDDAAEDTVEAALRHESAFEGDFGDRLFGITKKSAGFIYPDRVQKFWKAHLHHLRQKQYCARLSSRRKRGRNQNRIAVTHKSFRELLLCATVLFFNIIQNFIHCLIFF